MKYLNSKIDSVGFVIILALFLTACSDDYLSVSPKGSLDQRTLANEAGAQGTLMGAYSLLNGCGAVGALYGESKSVHSSMASDDAFFGTTAGIGWIAVFEGHSVDPTNRANNGRWKFLYAAIQRSNDVLRILDHEDANIPETSAQQIRAEAIFLRGVYHLEAKMTFGNIPYVDETISFGNDNYYVSNTEEVWPKIESDFQYAADNLNITKSDPGRANSWAAKAYLVKTYMFQAKFSEAQPLLNDIIANGVTSSGDPYDLHDEYHHNFDWEYRNGPEAVFPIQMSVDPAPQNGNCSDLGNGPYGGGAVAWGWLQPSIDLGDAFQTDENTGLPLIDSYYENHIKHDHSIPSSQEFTPHEGTLDSRIDWSMGRRGIPYLDYGVNPGRSWVRVWEVGGPYTSIKHVNWNSRPEGRASSLYTDTPYNLIRFADVLLWAAEVEVEIGSLSKAEMYVNRVRERAANPDGFVKKYLDDNDPLGGFSDEPAANYFVGLYSGHFTANGQVWAREAVRYERKLELAMEHHRWFDLQRYDLVTDGYQAETLNSYSERMEKVPKLDRGYIAPDAEFIDGVNHIYPIPQEQIDLSFDPEIQDFTLKQNPGY